MAGTTSAFPCEPCVNGCPLKMWVTVETSYYIFNLLIVILYYYYLNNHNRENGKFMIFNGFLVVVNVGWLVYGNALYFSGEGYECRIWYDTLEDNGVRWVMIF